MKKMFFYLAASLLTLVAVSCDKDDDKDEAKVANPSIEDTYYCISFQNSGKEKEGVFYLKDGYLYSSSFDKGASVDSVVLYKGYSYVLTQTDETSGTLALSATTDADTMTATYSNLTEKGGQIRVLDVTLDAKNILYTDYKDIKIVFSDETIFIKK